MPLNGTVVGTPSFATGKFGSCLTGLSDTNYVSLPSGSFPDPSVGITWEAWLKIGAVGAAHAVLSNQTDTSYMGVTSAGHFFAQFGSQQADSGILIDDGNWHHCAAVFTNAGLFTFVDGVAGGTNSSPCTLSGAPGSLFVGRYQSTGTDWTGGSVDELAIWNYARYSGSSLTVPTAAYTGTEDGLSALYHFDGAYIDSTAPTSNYDGSVTGAVSYSTGKFGQCIGGLSDTNFVTTPLGTLSAPTVTIEAWLKVSGTGTQAAVSNISATLWFGVEDSNFGIFVGGHADLDSGINISDGNWHHCAAVISASSVATFVDGVAGATGGGKSSWENDRLSIGRFGFVAGEGWQGEIDELAIWNVAKFTGSYSVPTGPYVGTELNLNALYHFDSDTTDSTTHAGGGGGGDTSTTIDPSDGAIIYSPFNWSVTSGFARTVNAGAYFRTIFSGGSVALTFDVADDSSPFPQIWVRVDNTVWTLVTLSSAFLSVATALDSGKKHMLEVVVKATTQTLRRWTSPQTMVELTGIVLDLGAALTAPVRRTKNILIYGDSITEGVLVYGSGPAPDTAQCDALGCYSYALTTAIDAEVGIVAFAAQGVTVGGAGGVPSLPTAYDLLYSGVSRSFTSPAPDLVIYNHGTNDLGGGSITTGLLGVVEAILSAAPSSKHMILVPFNGSHAVDISGVVSGASSSAVTSVDTTGWFSTSDGSDGLHPYNYASVDLIAPKLFPEVTAALYGSGGGGGGGGGTGASGGSYAAA